MKTRNELNLSALCPALRITKLLDVVHAAKFVCLLPVRICASQA